MPSDSLSEIYTHFVSRTDRLAVAFVAGLKNDSERSAIHKVNRFYCVIRLQHLWGEFCRELVTRSSIGGVRAIGGARLPRVRNIRNWKDVERIARCASGGRREISWHDTERVVGITRRLSPANKSQITDSITVADSPIIEIRVTRNYLVHPNVDTWRKYSRTARRLGVFNPDPDALLTAFVFQTDATRFEYWIIRLQEIALDAIR